MRSLKALEHTYTHLNDKPKCVQAKNEVKLKRHKIIQKIYVIVSFLVPVIILPWPFISAQYGKRGYVFWLVA